MHYAFVDTQQADFDPNAFQLPELLNKTQGPPVQSLPETPQLKQLKTLGQLTANAPVKVQQNLQQQVQMGISEQRADLLKQALVALQQTTDVATVGESLKIISSCYSGEQMPKDLSTMTVLHPLLKCQAYKWDQLQANQMPLPPAQEAGYLSKLRQLQGSLGPTERAALFRLISLINQRLEDLQQRSASEASESEASKPTETTSTEATSVAQEKPSVESLVDFDPMQASRLMLQLRAKLQRTHSPNEKQQLQAELQALQAQQQAHAQYRQTQAMIKQIQEFQADQARLKSISASHFETWRKLRIGSVQSLSRLFGQSQPEAVAVCDSAQRQLARLGMSEATEWIANERQRQSVSADLSSWNDALGVLLEHAIQATHRLAFQFKEVAWKRQITALEAVKQAWESQNERLQLLEQTYVHSRDAAERQQLKRELNVLYVERLAQLASSSNQADMPSKS